MFAVNEKTRRSESAHISRCLDFLLINSQQSEDGPATEAILQLPCHLSMHTGGVVVAPGALTKLVPVMCSRGKGTIITQLDLELVEALGLVKVDSLGIRGLIVMGNVAEFIQAN